MCKGRCSNAYSLEGRQKCESQVVETEGWTEPVTTSL